MILTKREKKISWKGKFRPPVERQTVYPRALDDQEISIWLAVCGTPGSIYRAGVLCLPLMLAIIGGMPSQFKDHVEYSRKVYNDSGHPAEKIDRKSVE